MLNAVTEIQVRDRHRLWVRFEDGVEGIVDVAGLLGRGIFAALVDEQLFRRAAIDEFGAVCWPNGADLAPDAMHQALVRDGIWQPGRVASPEAA